MAEVKNIADLRANFLALNQTMSGQSIIYLDSAASTLKPQKVVERVAHFLQYEAANVHRGAYQLSDNATALYEGARETVRSFINAADVSEVIFTRNTTEGLNLVAHSLGQWILTPGDEILLTELEHHSNIVPWQMVAERTGAKIVYAKVTEDGQIDRNDFSQKINKKTKILALQILSNSIGTLHPVKELIAEAQAVGARVVLDAAQAVSSIKTDVKDLDCDFLCFSGHKLFAPDGIGVVYGRQDLLNEMPPFLGGGSMIDTVNWDKTTYLNAPYRFEAGTPNVSGAVGLATSIQFLKTVNFSQIFEHEKHLFNKAEAGLKEIPKLRIVGENQYRHNVISFLVEGLHPSDVGFFVNKQGVCVRAGHLCCQPLMRAFGITGTVRVSFSIYNNEADVQRFVESVKKCLEFT